MAENILQRVDLLSAILEAHGGEARFNEIKSIEATLNLSGLLFDSKGYPGHRQLTITVDPHSPKTFFRGLGHNVDELWAYSPKKVWTENADGSVIQSRDSPRAAFVHLNSESTWDDMHFLYFVGYALWNYLTAPFLFNWPGFLTRELENHVENGETWRVLEVTFPDDIPTHNKIQRFYYDNKFMLRRLDYAPVVLGGGNASQYMFDHQTIGGLVFPTLRRVVPEALSGVFGPRLVLMDFCDITIRQHL
ncbi:hypothetical protein Asppvi_010111 [Aspergillus pseudoviridinutans]|uniref:Uncharacterized protein n=1 Tax=Aspergillus pseudoviridinutans TaxID=1517512 RepID=A0A9P3BNZ0_9EURO|nr:uncharacterized protein Asppvi_010111 [Aspergillus pseudoviridinutans]GIJ91146.1 hypothetical protein Asppvi_010111 [Aspergillus pseudoviridinutans]